MGTPTTRSATARGDGPAGAGHARARAETGRRISELCRVMLWAGAVSRHLEVSLTRHHGISMHEFAVLHTLRATPGTAMTRLASTAGLTRSGATRAVARLTDRDLVDRLPPRGDRRVVRLRLTPAGERLADRAADAVAHLLDGAPLLPEPRTRPASTTSWRLDRDRSWPPR